MSALRGLRFLPVAAALFLAACTSPSYEVQQSGAPSRKFQASDHFYVTVPADGRFGETTYTGSGATTASVIANALRANSARVDLASSGESLPATAQRARAIGANYMVQPTILHWEDRATTWNYQPDRVTIMITFIDSGTEQVLDTVTIKGTGPRRVHVGEGGRPEDLLREPIEQYIRSRF